MSRFHGSMFIVLITVFLNVISSALIVSFLELQKCTSKAFIPVMRSLWPGIYGNPGGSSFMVSQMRKRAVQASRFMLQMMQLPIFTKEAQPASENNSAEIPQVIDSCAEVPFECDEEGLAIRIAIEVTIHEFKLVENMLKIAFHFLSLVVNHDILLFHLPRIDF